MTIFCFLLAVVGWHYALFSSAASRMSSVESQSINHGRIWLRRVGGIFIAITASALFELVRRLQSDLPDAVCALLLLSILILLFFTTLLAFIDLRLTLRLKRQY